MSCDNCIKVKDLFSSLSVSDPSCTRQIARINRILRMFYLDTVWYTQNIVEHWFSWKNEIIIKAKYPIYKIYWFYWKWEWKCFREFKRSCSCWSCKKCTTKEIMLTQSNYWVDEWEYMRKCENEVYVNLWVNAGQSYMLYSRWPETITSLNDDICIDPYMLTWLELLIEWFYERSNWEANRMQVTDSYYKKWLDAAKTATQTDLKEFWQLSQNTWDWQYRI